MRMISIWPFPDEQIEKFTSGLKHVIVPEYNFGLLAREIERFRHLGIDVIRISQIGGGEPITPGRILDELGVYL